MQVELAWQGSLFGDDGPLAVDTAYATLRRLQLDEASWVDYAPGWLTGSDRLLAELLESGRWQQREVWMYDHRVLEPRLTAGWSTDVDGPDMPPSLQLVAAALSKRYGVEFDRVWVNLYRDGRDSVAWHGDRVGRQRQHTIVAILSLGEPRRFLLRPVVGGRSIRLTPGSGDLLVLGGTCQRTWQHSVPKCAHAGPRISVMFREAY
jgi:alkylated DNA repair dioxygenase AlkB